MPAKKTTKATKVPKRAAPKRASKRRSATKKAVPTLQIFTSLHPDTHPHHHRVRKVLLSLMALIVVGALAGYVLVFGSLSRYTIGGLSVTQKSDKSEVANQLKAAFSNYRFQVTDEKGERKSYSPAQAGVSLDATKTINDALKVQREASLLEKLSVWRSQSQPLALKTDRAKFEAFVDSALTHYITKPIGATMATDKGEVVTTADTPGLAYTISNPEATLLEAIRYLKPTDFRLSKQTVYAAITKGHVASYAAKAKKIIATPITLTIKGDRYTPDPSTIATWIDPITNETRTPSVEVNSGKVVAYIDEIADDYVLQPENQVVFTRPDGSETVIAAGRDGTDIADKAAIASKIAAQLTALKPVSIDLKVADAARGKVSAQTYDKWIIVDLTQKRLDAYEKDKLVKSFPISAGKPSTPTAVGQFKIYHKTRIQDMRGLNLDGSRYLQPDVEWNSFFYGDMAIHGNYWVPQQGWFGVYNSSHGCVGAANYNSKWIYEWAPIGTTVITHY